MKHAIEEYVLQRIFDNAAWYADKQMLAQTFALGQAQRVLYVFFSALLSADLQEGHTVLALSDSDAPLGVRVGAWYQACMQFQCQKWQALSAELFDFQKFFEEYQQQLQDNPTQLKSWVEARLATFERLISTQNKTLTPAQIKDWAEDVRLAMRAYYVFYVSAQARLEHLVSLLAQSPFFVQDNFTTQAIQAQTQPLPQAPIVYRYQKGVLHLWMNRAYRAEVQLVQHIHRLKSAVADDFTIADIPAQMNEQQVQALKMVAKQPFALITGGPGTGKTFTVAQIVLALYRAKQAPRLALAAPTGKAAQRMSESLQAALQGALTSEMALPEPKTIHRLLGVGSDGLPRYHQHRPLPLDMLIIDEASMLGTEMACHLFAAIKSGTRVILLGDAHQLAAVDAGAVLADLCRMHFLQACHVQLIESRRFTADSGIGQLARLINQADVSFVEFETLIAQNADLNYQPIAPYKSQIQPLYQQIAEPYHAFFELTKQYQWSFAKLDATKQQQVVMQLFETLNRYRILCAAHQGWCGDEAINEFVAQRHKAHQKLPPSNLPWYHGRVVMIVKNRYDLALFNGDIGICLWGEEGLSVYFEGSELRSVPIQLLDNSIVTHAYAITVHKSQGSEWQQVSVLFDEENRRLLSKELFYTAVSRAKQVVHIYSTPTAVTLALNSPTVRQTGLGILTAESSESLA